MYVEKNRVRLKDQLLGEWLESIEVDISKNLWGDLRYTSKWKRKVNDQAATRQVITADRYRRLKCLSFEGLVVSLLHVSSAVTIDQTFILNTKHLNLLMVGTYSRVVEKRRSKKEYRIDDDE